MPFYSDVTVLDIGSKSICALRAERLSETAFSVKSSFEMEYGGYYGGEWLCPEELFSVISKLMGSIERVSGKTKSVIVGIPAGFCRHKLVGTRVTFPQKKRVSASDLAELIAFNDPFSSGEFLRIHALPLGFLTEEGEIKDKAEKLVTRSLKTRIAYIGASREILSSLKQILSRCGVKEVVFIQSEFAAAKHLFSEEEKKAGVLIADIGYLSTSVMFVDGPSVSEMKVFSLGGAMVTAGLSESLGISYHAAEHLVSRVNLALQDDGVYEFELGSDRYSFMVSEVNAVVKECVDCLASYVAKAIDSFRSELPENSELRLFGGGLLGIRGASEYFSKQLGRGAGFVIPSIPNLNKPYFSTAVGLIKEAFELQKKQIFGFLGKLFGR